MTDRDTRHEALLDAPRIRDTAEAEVADGLDRILRRYPEALHRMVVAAVMARRAAEARDAALTEYMRSEIPPFVRRSDGGVATIMLPSYVWWSLERLSGLTASTLRRRQRRLLDEMLAEYEAEVAARPALQAGRSEGVAP